MLGVGATWIKFLSGAGATVLTFLAGAELDPKAFRQKWNGSSAIGLIGFTTPFLGCAAIAYYGLHRDSQGAVTVVR